jgi:acetyl-CoA carboxylase carboxyltransferase component
MSKSDETRALAEKIRQGGAPKYHQSNAAAGKLFCRERIARLCDDGGKDFVEDGLYANATAGDLPADGVVTGIGRVHGRPVAIMANDSTVKAGSWGARTVEKIIRIQETAGRLRIPLFYLVDSAGARITDQIDMFPGPPPRRAHLPQPGAPVGAVPQICLLFGTVGGGRGLHPRVLRRGVHGRGQRLDVPRVAPHGRDGDRREGHPGGDGRGAHALRGLGLWRLPDEGRAQLPGGRPPLPVLPAPERQRAARGDPGAPAPGGPQAHRRHRARWREAGLRHVRADQRHQRRGSFLEIKKLFAREIITGFARIEGRVVGLVANQPKWKGGVLFVDSADKAARFVWLCDAFAIPLVFLADVPGFMIGKAVERMGIIRHGAKMISAIADASVPKISVVVRKAYGAGLYAMSGPAFDADATLALPQAMIAVMGAEAAVNAVFANKIAAKPEAERPDYIEQLRQEYREDIDIVKLAANLHVDAIVQGDDLRSELARRLAVLATKTDTGFPRRRPVTPV